MNESSIRITEGVYSLPTHYENGAPIPESKQYFNPGGWYPARYWDVEFVDEDEEHIARYISGQVPLIEEEPVKHLCRRCQREIKRRYTYCWRCKCYLEKKVS